MKFSLAALLGAALIVGCTADPATAPVEANGPQLVDPPPAQISGTLTGPDGSNLCNSFAAGTPIRVRLFDTDLNPLVGGTQVVTCPANSYAMIADADTYAVAVQPIGTTFGTLPFRWLDTALVDNTSGPQVHDVQVLDGQPLPGSVTRDGVGIPGLAANIVYGDFRGVLATSVTTDAAGAWTESLGRSPMLLQAGQRYVFSCPTDFLASRPVGTPTSGVFAFPGELSSFDCAFTSADEVRFTHGASRLMVTALGGDIGGLNGPGLGWGVQFPIAPGGTPAVGPIGNSELFRGGLVLALAPDRILSGYSALGFQLCGGPAGDACDDFAPVHDGQIAHQGAAGRKIMWEMSDAASPEGVGLKVRQRSYDRSDQGGDFVWFQYRIENSSKADQTLFAGFWGDWDIGDDPFNDFGQTAMDGHLMYFHNDDGTGPFVGSLIVGPAPVAGNFAYVDAQNPPGLTPLARQFELASGAVTSPTTLESGDQRAYHTLGPITIRKKGNTTIWIAMVAGTTEAELFANAQAALAARPPAEP